MSATKTQAEGSNRRLFINALLASAEEILKSGRFPTRDQHDDILSAIRSGQEAAWDAFPLARSWFSQSR